tara:strand:- start:64 stop:210 length:147 start_codon:yes stop_codon:yes gene_type:complete
MSLVKSGFGDWAAVNKFSAEEVLDMIEFEEISADIENHKIDEARNGGN